MLQLSKKQIGQILKQRKVFEGVEAMVGVPWQAIAAIWYRESFSVASPKTPGGPFQFDPVPTKKLQDDLLRRFTSCTAAERKVIVDSGVNDFVAGAILAACWFRHSCKPVITPKATDGQIKDAFYGYNGRKYGTADKSPYVMNGYDEKHMNMRLRGTIPDASQPDGRRWVDIIDKRPGAFTVYKQLKAIGS